MFTTIFVNNAFFGLTVGKMAPTTMPNQKTTTSPAGRDVSLTGHPIRMVELLSTLKTDIFVARCSVHTPMHVIDAKKIIKKAFRMQKEDRCFSLVEVLSTCPTNWGITPQASADWVASDMQPYYPLGIYRDPEREDN